MREKAHEEINNVAGAAEMGAWLMDSSEKRMAQLEAEVATVRADHRQMFMAYSALRNRHATLLAAAKEWMVARSNLYDCNACPEDPTDPFPESDILANAIAVELAFGPNVS